MALMQVVQDEWYVWMPCGTGDWVVELDEATIKRYLRIRDDFSDMCDRLASMEKAPVK